MDSITLMYPYTLADGRALSSVSLRRPTVRDLKLAQRAGDTSADHEIAMIASLTGEKLTPDDLEAMDLADYAEIQLMFRRMQTRSDHTAQTGGDAGPVVPVPA